jgi:hypothetical protein
VSKPPRSWPQLALFAAFTVACATVVFEEPPSSLDEGGASGGGGGLGPAGTAGQGGTGSIAQGGNTAAQGGRAGSGGATGAAGSLVSTPQGGTGSLSLGGTGNVAQGGTGAVPQNPQFPSGTELLNDTFENGLVMWTPVGGNWGLSQDAETGSMVYGQSENTASAVVISAKGDAAWRDVRVELDFKVLSFNGSSTTYVAGVCVRVANGEDFYLAGLRSDGRFGVRRFSGGGSNLDSTDEIGAAGEWYHLRVDVIGSTLTLFLGDDEMQILTLTDAAHPAGAVGVCTAHASAVFDNIVVTAP